MSIFEPVTFTWEGVDYTIPSDGIMKLIAGVEDIITLQEMALAVNQGKVKIAHIAQAYGLALRYAGCRVTDEQVYKSMFSVSSQQAAIQSVQTLLLMMVPRDLQPTRGEPTKGKSKPAVNGSSNRRTRRRSAKVG